MTLRSRTATLAVVLTLTFAPVAAAAPVDVHVRVEGATSTLFDRVVHTDAITLQTADDVAHRLDPHVCDGTNNGAYPTPGATPTGATADAMATLGLDLDGQWYDGFADYFVKRIGTDAEDNELGYWWGILVNGFFTPVGGCQLQVQPGDEVLWVHDAFSGRPFLTLSGPATVTAGAPTTIRVLSDPSDTANPEVDGAPYAGAAVGAIGADARTVADGTVVAGPTDADGETTVTFSTPGWHRLKARDGRAAIASNSLDVCVEATAGNGCAGLPPSQQPVVPDRLRPVDPGNPVDPGDPSDPGDPGSPGDPGRGPQDDPPSNPAPDPGANPPAGPAVVPPASPPAASATVRLSAPQLDPAAAAGGRVGLRWRVLDAGPGVRGWTLAAKPLGVPGASFAVRSSGTAATAAALRLPAGRTYALRLTVTDALGRVSASPAGDVLVPIDDRARAAVKHGGWRADADDGAWQRTVSHGSAGARLQLRLAAGRPVVVVRGAGSARIELRADGRRRVFQLGRGRAGLTREIVGAARSKPGLVQLRVLRGSVSVDGAGVRP